MVWVIVIESSDVGWLEEKVCCGAEEGSLPLDTTAVQGNINSVTPVAAAAATTTRAAAAAAADSSAI